MNEARIFETSEASKALMPKLGDVVQDFAFTQAGEFVDAGQSIGEAGSIVAHLLIEAAWLVAGAAVLADGRNPDRDHFRAAVEDVLARIQFKDISEIDGGGA